MSAQATISHLLTEVAPQLDAEAVAGSRIDDEWSWTVAFAGEREIDLFLDDPTNRLTVSTAVGIPAPESAARLHERLLQYNSLWRETGGVRMAIDAPEGEVSLLFDVSTTGLDVVLLRNILGNFLAAADAWRALIAGQVGEETPEPAAGDEGSFLRV